MKLWSSLYALVWLGFFAIALTTIEGVERSFLSFLDAPFVYLHIILGIVIIVVAGYNSNKLQRTEAPMRIKRVARTALGMAIASAVTGAIRAIDSDYICFISIIHIVVTVALITQASSVATAYDMWEEKEFLPESERPPETAREEVGISDG